MQITQTVCVCVSDWIIEDRHTHAHTNSWQHSLNVSIVELILSSKILCTLRCVTFINSTTSYDKQNACSRYGCWRSLTILFFSILKKLPENIGWKKKKASTISNSTMLIRWLWRKSMWPNKTKQTKRMLAGQTDGAHAKKSPRWQILTPFIAWTEWKFVVCFSRSAIFWNRNIWYIYACQRLIILIAHSNHFR